MGAKYKGYRWTKRINGPLIAGKTKKRVWRTGYSPIKYAETDLVAHRGLMEW